MNESWYTIHNIHEIDTPALVVYPDRIRENIRILKTFVPDVNRLRPHVKTNKSAEVTKLMMDAGISKFKCATIAEAEMLAMTGAPDILLAYQPVGPKTDRLAELVKKYPASVFSCLIDDTGAASYLSKVFEKINRKINVFIDLNVGMNRTGITPSHALRLYMDCHSLPGINIIGLHAYDGHLRDADLALRTKHCNDAFTEVEGLQEIILKQGGKNMIVVVGGTPTFPIHAKRKNVECSPGTFIYWDKGYESILPEQPFLFAALVVTRIISKPNDETICIDLGHKSIASENPLNNRVYFLNAPELQPIGHSEEHMVFKVDKNNSYTIGDVFYGVPYHICPSVALHENALVVEKHEVIESWNVISRKRKITI